MIALGPDTEHLSLPDFASVVSGEKRLVISEPCRQKMDLSRGWMEAAIDERRVIYGITTGFGPLAGRMIDPGHITELQRNLVYHLASGVGRPFSRIQTRAILAARALNLSKGHSGVRTEALQLLLDCLDADLLPVIPCMGTVGASGDLTPLSHMMLGLMGEGMVRLQGELMPAAAAFAKANLQPLSPEFREALAFVNGTSVMTAVAALNANDLERAIDIALRSSVLYAELLEGRMEAFHPGLAMVRPHPGQAWATAEFNRLSAGSDRLRPHSKPTLPDSVVDAPVKGEVPQDPYTIRCVPQIFGAIADVLTFHNQIVRTELNSVTDNPVFVDGDAIHGGNFYGQHVAFASDALMTAIVKLAIHSERKIARITDESQNRGLPAFLQGNKTGLHSGFMGAQVTASAIVAEMRAKCVPASIQSIPTNANNQDVVSMGTIAARRASELIDHLYDLLAIESLIMVQGLEIRGGAEGAGFCASSRDMAAFVRSTSPFLERDRPLSPDIEVLSARLRSVR